MDRQERLAQAGRWLLRQREERQLSVRKLATQLDVTTQVVYDWQNGKNAVSDDKAEKIAEVFGMNIVEVRRNLGLWVPEAEAEPDDRYRAAYRELVAVREQLAEITKTVDRLQNEFGHRAG